MEKISHYDRKKADIIPFSPEKDNVHLSVEQAKFEAYHNSPISKFEIFLFYGDPDIEYDDACKDFDEFVINELEFKIIQFIMPDLGGTGGYVAFKFVEFGKAEEIKTELENKLKELGKETQIDEYTQIVCPKCTKDPFRFIGDFYDEYCKNCGEKLPEKEGWAYGEQRVIRIM